MRIQIRLKGFLSVWNVLILNFSEICSETEFQMHLVDHQGYGRHFLIGRCQSLSYLVETLCVFTQANEMCMYTNIPHFQLDVSSYLLWFGRFLQAQRKPQILLCIIKCYCIIGHFKEQFSERICFSKHYSTNAPLILFERKN